MSLTALISSGRLLLSSGPVSLMMFVQTWSSYFAVLQSVVWVNLFAFVLPLAVFIVLYLICASALPNV